jgi:hypothetical protein
MAVGTAKLIQYLMTDGKTKTLRDLIQGVKRVGRIMEYNNARIGLRTLTKG